MQRPLERLAILSSRDFGCAEAFLAGRHIELELNGSAGERALLDVHYNGIYLPRVWFGYIGYGAPVTTRISPRRGDFWVNVPLHGCLESLSGRAWIHADQRKGLVVSPREVIVVKSSVGAARLSLCIKGDALAGQLAVLLDEAPRAELEFHPEVSLESGFGRFLAYVVHRTAKDLERSDWLRCPLAASYFEQSLMTALLLSQPNNHTQALRGRAGSILPRDVARAVDYIHENLAEPITLADLVRESGVAGRTLLKHFHDFKGVSPMRYLRNLRLKRIRDELESGAGVRVSESALRWGFPHAGRFSIEYRKRFGESPSATLARRRN